MMSSEYFFGVTLSAASKEFKWEPDELKENGTGDISLTPKGEHCLLLKQAVLVGGTEGEINVVEAETSGYKAQFKMPVVALVGGKVATTLLDLNFPDPPVNLRLIEGSGPVHIAGVHVIQTEQYDDDDDEEDDYLDDMAEEEEEDDEEVETETKAKGKEEKSGKKRSNSNSGGPAQPSKKKRGAKDDA